jgi:hypothetical protein
VFDVAMNLVILLLLVIIELLCVPLKQRSKVLQKIDGIAALVFAAIYIGPTFFGSLVVGYQYVSEHLGWPITLCIVAGAVYLTMFIFAWRSDRKENEAIRSGSEEAFNRRVETYKSDPYNYDHARAVEAATRIKEGK